MPPSFSKPSFAAPEESQLSIRPEAATLDPLPQKVVLPWDAKSVDVERRQISALGPLSDFMNSWPSPQRLLDLNAELRAKFLVCVERKNIFARSLVDGRILLSRVALPLFNEDLRAEGLRNLHRAISRAGVDRS